MANQKQKMTKGEEEEEAELYGDVLEFVLSKIHLIHLLPARHVSKSWNLAASSSMRCRFSAIKTKPWLIIHTQTTRFPYVISARAYDAASHVWLDIVQNHHHPSHQVSTLRSSHSTLLYMLSPSTFAFSLDALHLEWHYADAAPRVGRVDPIVAKIGHHVVVAGGACFYEDDPLAMEIYNVELRGWDTCGGSMPAAFKDSAASTWLSVAVDERKMYVMEKSTGVMYSFNPETKTWFGPYDMCLEATVFNSHIGFVNGGLILAGVVGEAEDVRGVKLWEVKSSEDDESLKLKDVIGEMPESMLDKLKGESDFPPSITMSCMGGLVCLYKSSDPSPMILCEIENRECRWNSITNEAVDGMKRMVVTCTSVGLPELQKAIQVGALKIQ